MQLRGAAVLSAEQTLEAHLLVHLQRTAASLIGRLGQVHFIAFISVFVGSLSLIRVKLLFAVIVGPVR